MKPTRESTSVGCMRGDQSNTRISPAVGSRSPTARCRSVVLPAPFGPTRPMTRPAGRARSQSRSAHVFRYRFVSPIASSAAFIVNLLIGLVQRQGQHADDAFAIEARGERCLDPSIERPPETHVYRPRQRMTVVLRHERSEAWPALHQSLALELAVGLENRVQIDREALDDLTGRRQLVAG